VGKLIDTIGGLYELVRLGVLTRFDFRGPYWTWRLHTAFGNEPVRGAGAVRSVLRYSRWVYRHRRGG